MYYKIIKPKEIYNLDSSKTKVCVLLNVQEFDQIVESKIDPREHIFITNSIVDAEFIKNRGFDAYSFGEFFKNQDHFDQLRSLDNFSKRLEEVAIEEKCPVSIRHSLIYFSRFNLAKYSFYLKALFNFLNEHKNISQVVLINYSECFHFGMMQEKPIHYFWEIFERLNNTRKQKEFGLDRNLNFKVLGKNLKELSNEPTCVQLYIYKCLNYFSLWTLRRVLRKKAYVYTTDSHGMVNIPQENDEIKIVLLNGINKVRLDYDKRNILKDSFQVLIFNILYLLRIKNNFFKIKADYVFDFFPLNQSPQKYHKLFNRVNALDSPDIVLKEVLKYYNNHLDFYNDHFSRLDFLSEKLDDLFNSVSRQDRKNVSIISAHSLDGTAVLGEIVKKYGLRGILISHGSHHYPKDSRMRMEMTYHAWGLLKAEYPICAVQSPLAKNFLENLGTELKLVDTGPILWGRKTENCDKEKLLEKLGIPLGKRIIVHAATYRFPESLRFVMYETVEEYLKSINNLIQAVEQVPDSVLLVKFRSHPLFRLQDLRSLIKKSKVIFFSEVESFGEVLNIADLVISFSSTTMEEAIENFVPVLQYGGNGRFDFLPGLKFENERDFKRNALYTVRDESSLSQTIKRILEEYEQKPLTEEEVSAYRFPVKERVSLNNILNGVSK